MRENLFKAQRIDNSEWVEGFYLSTQSTHYIVYAGQFDDDLLLAPENICIPVYSTIVCQYTGLTDKNGVKIFEGDVVEAGFYKWKCQVVWEEKCARFIGFTIEGEHRIVYVDMVDKNGMSAIEVVGNIFDGKDDT